ncbi:DUF3224 domain-containing protein [Lysobacter solisilvae (ex Woo and Kim 2020)]|uniref:DUF3224 domain-containing protein n=1 Tax=Agrilutibacter terrestris TaxID=2865112 RepID=A0A7H0FV95_9GAMM|nr:DUF3224 domain-containing protein [Lysobacter terrestris]QNP39961.1 DUF3224 domain-containing protein [Lysobacter terrestris]
MSQQAKGPFDVKRTAMESVDAGGEASFGRIRFEKRFHGDLDATSVVEMLSAGNPASGSAGYVAVEHVTGTLQGRRGSFMLQHSGTLDRGEASLVVSVVPDTGTDELAGLRGNLRIDIAEGGAHSYTFDYALD